MNRRDLIYKVFVGGTVLTLTPSVIASCSKDEGPAKDDGNNNPNKLTLDLASATYAALNTAGGSVLISNKGIIVANTGNNVIVALDSTCTHEGCTIGFNPASNTFPCPCHGSIYAATGAVINGPAPLPVQSHPVTRTGNIITIDLG